VLSAYIVSVDLMQQSLISLISITTEQNSHIVLVVFLGSKMVILTCTRQRNGSN